MGNVKRLELWCHLHVTSLPGRDVRNIRPLDFCWTECTITNLVSHLAHICISVCSHRQVYVIYFDVNNASNLIPQTLVTSLGTTTNTRTQVASDRQPTPASKRLPRLACPPSTHPQCLLPVSRTDHLVALRVMSSQAKELTEGENCREQHVDALGPFSLSWFWLLRWAPDQTSYIITGKCAYRNDFEPTLKHSDEIAHDFFLHLRVGLGGTLFGWLGFWAHTGVVLRYNHVTVNRHLDEAAVPDCCVRKLCS